MLTDIRSRDEDFGERDRVIRQKEEAKKIFGLGIIVDDACDIDNELNGQLSDVI